MFQRRGPRKIDLSDFTCKFSARGDVGRPKWSAAGGSGKLGSLAVIQHVLRSHQVLAPAIPLIVDQNCLLRFNANARHEDDPTCRSSCMPRRDITATASEIELITPAKNTPNYELVIGGYRYSVVKTSLETFRRHV